METTLIRTKYGNLAVSRGTTDEDRLAFEGAAALVAMAVKQKLIPAPYYSIGRDHKGRYDGSALQLEIYDFSLSKVLVCVREVEGSRYGVKTTSKEYYLISLTETGGLVVSPAPKHLCARASKMAGRTLGAAIAAVSRGRLRAG